ncbi:protein translocase subunit SecD [Nakamurella flavida]|uniref:Protein translocase subunit SecD n=1 Tax=Nakamurella flavida TaxID=363630 RepID=A0A938YQ34_9ACTN|nr:protein translocase subunit SecD [Nakamurella flavida]MBM9477402.1 protein translocase subunit SecD [Nakamurella flavida]MDP9777335.1 preprotein translocase subunit SecD [Nakamurella flavida]
MATAARQFRPWRSILIFCIITAGLYGLVFLTPGSTTPKLGIDLQGGTRITLTARTLDGSEPSRTAMQQARTIMEGRVNGSGVAGAQIQIDGSRQLVITVPGNEDLNNLTRSAQLNIRPVAVDPSTSQPIVTVPGAALTPSTAPATGTDGAPATSGATSTTGEQVAPATTESPAAETPAAETPAAETPAAETPAAETPASQGLRADQGAVRAAPGSETPAAETPAAETAAVETPAATPSADGSLPATTVSATPPPTDASVTAASAAETSGSVAPTWPTGSDPANPTQPLPGDDASYQAWITSATTALPALTCEDLAPYRGLDDPAKPLLACSTEGDALYLLEPTLIPGTEIDTATAGFNAQRGLWTVNLNFKSAGYATWSSYTAGNIGKLTAMTLDGQVLSAPSINQAITTPGTEISGAFNQETANALANSLKFGALPLAFDRAESVNVSAQLGLEYLQAGLIAGGIGLLLVIIYCLVYYRMLGVVTILSLVLSFGLVYAILVLLGRWIGLSLDMAGVAGLIIAIGITADSFVIYFERLKDEVREGRSFRSAVPRGWVRAKRTILAADAVSFLSAAILYVLAVGEVKGFAFTLGLTTVLDLVVVFLVTHPLVHLASGSKAFASSKFSGLGGVAKAGARQRTAAARLAVKEA